MHCYFLALFGENLLPELLRRSRCLGLALGAAWSERARTDWTSELNRLPQTPPKATENALLFFSPLWGKFAPRAPAPLPLPRIGPRSCLERAGSHGLDLGAEPPAPDTPKSNRKCTVIF